MRKTSARQQIQVRIRRLTLYWALLICLLGLSFFSQLETQARVTDEVSSMCTKEPNSEIAATWWPPLRNVWTPIGWKSHPFRFCVIYNGTLVANPHPLPMILDKPIKQYLAKYQGLGAQLTFTPSPDGALPERPDRPYRLSATPDGGIGLQRWTEDAAPVLETRWPCNFFYGNYGIVLTQQNFGHLAGGGDVVTGQEPIYAWTRIAVSHVDELSAPEFFHMMVHIGSAEQIGRSMFHEDNLTVYPTKASYPRVLTKGAPFQDGAQSGCQILEEDGTVRLVAQTETGAIELIERTAGSRDYYLNITLPAVVGFHADLLLPMIQIGRAHV